MRVGGHGRLLQLVCEAVMNERCRSAAASQSQLVVRVGGALSAVALTELVGLRG